MIEDVFNKIAQDLIDEMRNVIPKASGKTSQSLEAKVTAKGFEIWGDKTIGALINGRKPTKDGAAKGSPTVKESILEWIKIKGITPREPNMSQETLAFLISRSIHRKGFKGRGNFFANILNQKKFDSISSMVLNAQIEITSNIIKI